MRTGWIAGLPLLALGACAGPGSPTVASPEPCVQVGVASWYRPAARHGNGPDGFTAAHVSLPFGTAVRVTDLATGRSVVVHINDRGPFKPGRVIDLSAAAADSLGIRQDGVARVRLEPYQPAGRTAAAVSTAGGTGCMFSRTTTS